MVYYKTSNKNLMFGEFLKHQVVYFPVKKEGEYYIFKEVSDMSKEELVFRIKKANELYSHYSNYRKLVRQVVNHAKTSSSVLLKNTDTVHYNMHKELLGDFEMGFQESP